MELLEPYKELEQKFAEFTGSKYAVSCSTGTAALHLALLAAGVGPGDEVIVPDFTMAAVAFAVSYTGAKPVFVDVELENYGMSPDEFKKNITKNTKAVIVVHTYGRLARINNIIKIAKEHQIKVIEDAAEAHGAVFRSNADMTCYSFYKNKIVAGEEGGAVTTNKKSYANIINDLKNMAFGKKHDFYHKRIGYNYRLSNVHASLILASLACYTENLQARRFREVQYTKIFNPIAINTHHAAPWFYEQLIPKILKQEALDIYPEARDSFKPLSSFPMYKKKSTNVNAKLLAKHMILLPLDQSADFEKARKLMNNISIKLNLMDYLKGDVEHAKTIHT